MILAAYSAPDLIAIISAASAAIVAIITAIGAIVVARTTARKVEGVDAKLVTRNGKSVGTQIDQLTSAQAVLTPPELRTEVQAEHLATAPPEELPPRNTQ